MDRDKRDSSRPTAREARDARLAAALRANLRRRKTTVTDEAGGPPRGDGDSTMNDKPDRD